MHADIYDGNLVLKGGDPRLGIRCGILIDLDYAFFREQVRAACAIGIKTVGTSQCGAVNVVFLTLLVS